MTGLDLFAVVVLLPAALGLVGIAITAVVEARRSR
jgi:hypothetical protein